MTTVSGPVESPARPTPAATTDAGLAPNGDMTTRNDERGLDEIKELTRAIREQQAQIARLSKRRREVVLRLRDHRITYRELADAMGVSEVTVYKVIRGEGQ